MARLTELYDYIRVKIPNTINGTLIVSSIVASTAAIVAVGALISVLTSAIEDHIPVEISKGNVPGIVSDNKFGRNIEIDAGVMADIWDGGHTVASGGTSLIWVAPTVGAVHNIVSTSSSDDGDPVGVGARTVRIYGLTDWTTAEINETITLNGTSNVATANSYVIIHRMKVLTKGAANINVGKITATATAPSATTVTAIIRIGNGQTQMAIVGIPSSETDYLWGFYASINKAVATAVADVNLVINPTPDTELINFITKSTVGMGSVGTSHFHHVYPFPLQFEGPAIVKLQIASGTNNIDVAAGFDFIRITN